MFSFHFDCNDKSGDARRRVSCMRVHGPDGHGLALDGPESVFHIRKSGWGDGHYVVFGRTCGDVDNVTHHTMGLIWSGFSADEQVARRLVRYAVNRGWKLTECTADHPLRDLWPGQMGEPTLVKP